ncbi:hypothetical protein NKF06_02195 [Haloferax sp. AB510]|uniref:hypothetical protein n=1 Tax=Haloferax sp. AB510 TaxID=2934172 RepID=UPI00209C0D20|nr:hypothetical protein [Haloferax sp. AB510]MCO8265424.1 hypothetical protein [Haloferax sp. AB510]
MLVAIHGLREYLDLPYRRFLDILREISDIVGKLGLSVEELLDFNTVCARKQALKTWVWRMLLRLPMGLFDTGEIQAIDSTSIAHRSSSHNYAKRVKGTLLDKSDPRRSLLNESPTRYTQRTGGTTILGVYPVRLPVKRQLREYQLDGAIQHIS